MNEIIEQLHKNKNVFYNLLKDENKIIFSWKPSAERWSLLEIVCHLFDEERNDFRFRVQWVLNKPHQIPPPIDPQGWVKKHNYIEQDYNTMLEKFIIERTHSISWLKTLENVNWNNSFEHSKLGTLTAKHFITNWLAHDYLHIKQILKLKYDYLKHQSGESLDYAGVWK